MTDTAIVGRDIEVLQTTSAEGRGVLSFPAVLAGALAATAMTFILLSLGSGIGFLTASPYSSGPSAKTLTIIGAIWIVLAQAWGYAVGGYLAGRLRPRMGSGSTNEANFRDGAHGFAAWALGVVLTILLVALGAAFGAGLSGHVAATLGAGAASGAGQAANSPAAYYVDTLFRVAPSGGAAAAAPASAAADTQPAAAARAGATEQDRSEVVRLLGTGMRDGKLSDEDRAYLGRVIAARTGLTPDEANRRVDETLAQFNKAAKDAADKAAKASAYFSFWSFMALLFGAAAATVGGVVGGNHRDENIVEVG